MTERSVAVLDKEDLRAAVAEVFDVDAIELTDDAGFVDLEVDSLLVLEAMVMLEKKYDVKLSEDEFKQFSCLRMAYELLSRKLGESG